MFYIVLIFWIVLTFIFYYRYVGYEWVRSILFSPHFVFCPKERVTLVFCRNILCIFAIISPEKLRFNLNSKYPLSLKTISILKLFFVCFSSYSIRILFSLKLCFLLKFQFFFTILWSFNFVYIVYCVSSISY